MNLLIIFTGGTIGSSVRDGYISVDEGKISALVDEALSDVGSEAVDVKIQVPYTILSETLNGTHIASLVRCINENIDSCDGIIVCHGTDTLQYTAAALGFAFAASQVHIPIVLVSSNYVLEDSRANGRENMKVAIDFITKRSRAGVWVSYERIYGPFELLPHHIYDDSLYTLGESYEIPEFDTKAMNNACLSLGEKSGILWIKAYVGMSYETYVGADIPTCILLDSYHSGTIDTSDSSLLTFTKWAKDNEVPVYLLGLEAGVSYETTKIYRDMGIEPLGKFSPITAYMWLWIKSVMEK